MYCYLVKIIQVLWSKYTVNICMFNVQVFLWYDSKPLDYIDAYYHYYWKIHATSVADPDPVFLGHPDPDPGKYRIRILYQQKDPCNSNFHVKYNCLKYRFVQIIFIFDFVIRCLDLVRKCHKKIFILLNIKNISISRIRIRSDPDPYF